MVEIAERRKEGIQAGVQDILGAVRPTMLGRFKVATFRFVARASELVTRILATGANSAEFLKSQTSYVVALASRMNDKTGEADQHNIAVIGWDRKSGRQTLVLEALIGAQDATVVIGEELGGQITGEAMTEKRRPLTDSFARTLENLLGLVNASTLKKAEAPIRP